LALLGAPFERLDCDPAAADTALFCARYGFDPSEVANTILVASKGEPRRFAACVVGADRQLDVNHKVRHLLNAGKASFAVPEETEQLTGMLLGGVSPFGLPNDLPVFIDDVLASRPALILGGGDRHSKIRVSGEVLLKIAGAQAVPDLGRSRR
jgi:prolyl-tRNA editing enzyme YbaK/EbsC (Cys-tRNA(Pro) deacylase)